MECLWVGEKRVGREKGSLEKHHISIGSNLKYHVLLWGLSLDPGALLTKFRNGLSPVWDGWGEQWHPELCLTGLAPGPGATLLWTDIQITHFIFVFQFYSWGEGRQTYSLKCQIAWEPLQTITWVMHVFTKFIWEQQGLQWGTDFVPSPAEISRNVLSVFILLYANSVFLLSSSSSFSFLCLFLFLLLCSSITIWSLYVAQTGIELAILLPHPVKCWDYRWARPCM